MYIPRHFEEKNPSFVEQFIGEYPFAELISVQKNGRLVATHIPFILIETGPELVLGGHISAANTSHNGAEDQEVMAIFREPHAYVSPKYYDQKESVPTWNYAAVHLYGRLVWIDESQEKHELMRLSVAKFESDYQSIFESLSSDYLEKMLKGIRGFYFKVNHMEAKRKLSQNKNENERSRIADGLADGNELSQKISSMMR